ncbi:hypothetical protein ABZP36_020241 [Zizania latifolia]
MTKHPRDGEVISLSLSLSLGASCAEGGERKKPRRSSSPAAAAGGGEFVCKTCSRAFPSFQALGGHRTSHLRGRHGLALGIAAAAGTTKEPAAASKKVQEKPAASHECHICGQGFEMGQALGGHMRRHREEAGAHAQAPPVLLELFV